MTWVRGANRELGRGQAHLFCGNGRPRPYPSEEDDHENAPEDSTEWRRSALIAVNKSTRILRGVDPE